MYKNIIFDFGGVVVDFAPKDFLMDHFMNRRAEEETYALVFGSQEWLDLDRGIISREQANQLMLENAALPSFAKALIEGRASPADNVPSIIKLFTCIQICS